MRLRLSPSVPVDLEEIADCIAHDSRRHANREWAESLFSLFSVPRFSVLARLLAFFHRLGRLLRKALLAEAA